MADTLGRGFVLRVVLSAAAVAFVLETLLSPGVANALGRLVGYVLSVPFFWLIGWWLGTRTWPKRGRKLARRMALAAMKRRAEVLFVSDRPDADRRLARRVWEVVGFAAGSSVLLASLLIIIGVTAAPLGVLASSFTIVALWAGFLLVPYWLFAGMGLRSVDAVRWLVLPVSRRYADRLKLSNGALVLLGLGALFNALYRQGLSQDEAIAGALITVLRIVASVLVVAAPAVAYYHRDEHGLVRVVEAELLDLGVRDGRGMTDGEFLPRLPPPKVAPPEPEPLMDHKLMRP